MSILNEMAGNSFMVFCGTCNNVQRYVYNGRMCAKGFLPLSLSLCLRTAILLRTLGLHAIPLHGKMPQVSHFHHTSPTSHPHPPHTHTPHSHPHSQAKRLGALNKFKTKSRSILVATDVASRGLDIPHVDVVVNFDIPTHSKVSVVSSGQFWHLTPPPHRTTYIEWVGLPELVDLGDP